MANTKLRVLPLGGLGEIGKNMTVVEYDGSIVVVDTGLRFPTAEQVGIDLVLPDFTYLRERADDIEGIVITHGHEDHLGALPWILRELGTDIPVFGGPLTMAMARSKLDEHRLKETDLTDVTPGEKLELGPFDIELIHMTHSIPDMMAVALTTDLGTMLITGDYKFDQTPVDGKPADVTRLAEIGREGLLLLCGDSTNADRPGFSPSESVAGPGLESTFGRCQGRIVVTCFASNIHRVQQVIDAAKVYNRKVVLVGRSMRKNINIGRTLGHIDVPDGMLVQPREARDFPDEKLVIVSTGSQGEPLSALRRMAYKDHPQVELHKGDTVVFAATPIPGNERAVNDTIDRLYHIGCDVITAKDAPIHASGHGYQEEIKLMLNLTQPKYVMPFHGDHKRIHLHAELAEAVGVK
ncbi:MAG: ribonuclease, partial [Conexibacter sp.]|nr:ribonuclease [Conexibacter sp.]